MRDLFHIIDRFNTPLRDQQYWQRVVFIFSLSMIIPWIALGFDSGVGMLEVWGNNWRIDYSQYGQSLHFSAFVTYGFLYLGFSKHLQTLEVKRSRNIFYSACLVLLNIGLFECIYMALFNHYQIGRGLWEWITSDILFLQQYFLVVILGAVALLGFYVESYQSDSFTSKAQNETFHWYNRIFKFKLNITLLTLITTTIVYFLVWIYYPWSIEIQTVGSWTSNSLFPQTHYAYFPGALYIQNELLHFWNILTKACFAFTHYYLIRRFKPC